MMAARWHSLAAGAALALLGALPAPSVSADPAAVVAAAPVGVRFGNHRDFGRVVFDLPPGSTWRTAHNGTVLTIRFNDEVELAPGIAGHARNVAGIERLAHGAALSVAPGAHARAWRLGDRLVVDVFDPAVPAAPVKLAAPPAHAPGVPAPAALALVAPTPLVPPPVTAAAFAASSRDAPPPLAGHLPAVPPPPAPVAPQVIARPSAPKPAPLEPVAAVAIGTRPAPPLSIAARLAPARAGGPAVTLPFAAGTGAAAFRRAGTALVVFDAQRPIDLAPLRDDPAFAGAAITLLPAATVLRLKLPAGQALSLTPAPSGWTVTIAPEAPAARTIRPKLEPAGLLLPAEAPGAVVSLPDPETGGTLLVGTQTGPGQAMPVDRRAPQFALLPSWQGVVVAPASDALRLGVTRGGFLLSAAAGTKLALSAPNTAALAAEDAAALSRRYDFPDLPAAGLMRRLQAAIDAAATAPPQARGPKRVAVGEALVALGMGAEAGSVLHLAGAGDGRLADDPGRIGLSAIAAILENRQQAGRDPTAGIDDPRLNGSDEITLWRALRDARQGRFAEAAPALAASYRLLLAYPAPLRRKLLPLAAETMARGGEAKAAAALLAARKDDPSLLLARAMLAEQGGDTATALALYDRAATSRDRLLRARASFRAIELRVAGGALSPGQAADALDRQIMAWRGDGRELRVRQREAALRAEAGEPRRALALLRETTALFPRASAALHEQGVKIFTAALDPARGHKLPPLELVALADENPGLVPDGEAGRVLASQLADRLVALELPGRAIPVLRKLADNTPPGDARSTLGARLAELRLGQGDARGALESLAATLGVGHLPPELLQRRTLLYARAAAATGQLPQALRALSALDTAAADEARATLLEQAKNWPAARDALLAWTARIVPRAGALDETQAEALLRLASAAAQAGDEALLARLRKQDLPRFAPGHLADMFRLLTARPVDAVADLGRAAQETQLASRIPAALKSLTSIANP